MSRRTGGYKGDKFSVFISRPELTKKDVDWETSDDGKGYDVLLYGEFYSYHERFPDVQRAVAKLEKSLKEEKRSSDE